MAFLHYWPAPEPMLPFVIRAPSPRRDRSMSFSVLHDAVKEFGAQAV
jgi:hypothetical protein